MSTATSAQKESHTMTSVSKYRTQRGHVEYCYENEHGAMVATRTLSDHCWRVRLYADPETWDTYSGLAANQAERMCLEHVAAMS